MSEAGHTERLEAALDGKYRIERKLGEGGMASVYLAEDVKHKRNVALKILRPELAAVLGSERFLAEIQTTANLQHPHILPLFDSGEADGYLYYVMPYIDGETLREKLDREKQLGVEEAVRIARDVADALDYAHRAGVIHRDIKPGNILLHDGRPVVADFGIALAVSAAGGGRMTETGLSLGTPHYMSPEQASADRDLSPKSDVYSLGCVLYEMLAGQPPHTGPSAQSILVHILTEEPRPLTALRHTVPPNVAAAVAKSIEKLPADRFETAKAFVDALDNHTFTYQAKEQTQAAAGIPSGPALATPTSESSRWRRLATVLAALLVASSTLAAWALLRPEAPGPLSRQYFSTEGWAGLDANVAILIALAPDGSSMILPVEGEPGAYQLGLKPRESEAVTPIPGTEGAASVVYSPDGRSIAYAVGTELRRRPTVGGATITLASDVATGTPGLAWLDDGTILYDQETPGSSGAASVVRISEDGGAPLGVVVELAEIYHISGLPGGRGALVIGCPSQGCGGDANNAYLLDLESGASELLLEQAVRTWYVPTGHIVYVRTDGAVFAAPFDLASLTLGASGVPLFEGVLVGGQAASMFVGADGTLLYVEAPATAEAQPTHRLLLVDPEGNEEPIDLTPRQFQRLALSPDGESLAYMSEFQIYTYNFVLRTTPRPLTFDGLNYQPIFSPDGQRVAFSSARDGTQGPDIFIKNLEDDSPPQHVITLPGPQYVTDWPTDSLLVFEHRPGAGVIDLWTLDLADPEAPLAEEYLGSEANLTDLAVSPDGTLAAYRSGQGGEFEILIRRFPEPGEPTLVTQSTLAMCCASWAEDGTLYFTRQAAPGAQRGVFFAARIQRGPVPLVLSVDSLFTTPEGTIAPYPGAGSFDADGNRWILARLMGAAQGNPDAESRERPILVDNWFEELRQRLGEN